MAYARHAKDQRVKPRRTLGSKNGTYDRIVDSIPVCELCKITYHALLQFGVARRCQQFSRKALSEWKFQKCANEVDEEIRRNTGRIEVRLKAETEDPFISIHCYCYFRRLHLFTTPAMLDMALMWLHKALKLT